MVCRTYPIRVAGNSGPMKNEISWDELNRRTGGGIKSERTTVTKKIRRIAEWDDELFIQSCILNCPTEIALTFVDYIDPSLRNCTNRDKIMNSPTVKSFLSQHGLDGRVSLISTGPDSMVEV
jgi:adenylosuccinate synthase